MGGDSSCRIRTAGTSPYSSFPVSSWMPGLTFLTEILMKQRTTCLWMLFASILFGCSTKPGTDYGQMNLLSVSGTITLDGKPLPNAVVTFEDPDQGTFSYGMTDGSGVYRLRFDSEAQGCTSGEKRVEISTTRKILGLNSSEEGAAPEGEGGGEGGGGGGSSTPAARELVPPRYNKKSELVVQVSSSTTTHDFKLTSQ